ncbi:MAG: DUF5107 domain-containing protein [Mucilaginibacter sp.]
MQVKIWQETISLPTYRTGAPDKNPMFFENRVYQGSSGVVYPNPVIEKIEDEKVDMPYNALFLENAYLKIMILPELGGRVHMAYDKIAKRNFIYYNEVVKPALVGLCGPWISGGIEFNWPQHHRPSTYDPIDFKMEENPDGSKTVWVNEVEKMFHTKGMAGFTLHPEKAYLEIRAQLYNRTNLPQTFLWWANPAVSVNDDYQSVFPPDVNAVFDHGKRDVSTFPIATGVYYKVDYSPGTDISKYKNIPVPTSYMAVNSKYNFVGGYENDTRAGVLHVADHHVSPGKKQWTWGNGDFGIAWDRNLTDSNGPYIELMTGVFTDNQPDFTWLMPYEEKSFVQYFLPYREVGLVKNATKDILIGLDNNKNKVTLTVFGTSIQKSVRIVFAIGDSLEIDEVTDLAPEKVYTKEILLNSPVDDNKMSVRIYNTSGKEVISYTPGLDKVNPVPEPAKAALFPEEIDTTEKLFLNGQHLEQYRHATYSPVPYYEEALKRDPSDIRNNNALGAWYLRRGKFAKAEGLFRAAINASTSRNPNPYDSEPYYNLGLSLKYQFRYDEAYDAFFKATWSSAWQDSGYYAVAQIDLLRGDAGLALDHINWSIDRNARNGKAYMVKVIALKELGRIEEAILVGEQAMKRDRFNFSTLFALSKCYQAYGNQSKASEALASFETLTRGFAHTLIDYAIEFAEIGLIEYAIQILQTNYSENSHDPMLNFYLTFYYSQIQDEKNALLYSNNSLASDKGISFANRLEDILMLQGLISYNKNNALAYYYLGNLWYDKKQYEDAITNWQLSSSLDSTFPTVLRNLAIAAYNKQKDPEKAKSLFEKAFTLNQKDARVLMELDQLYKKINVAPATRLNKLSIHIDTVGQRDDLYLEMIALNNYLGNFPGAYEMIISRKFHPWEGGEGKVSGQFIYSLIEMAKIDIQEGNYQAAVNKLQQARAYPVNLGEGKLPRAQENDIFYWLGCAFEGIEDNKKAHEYWKLATIGLSEPSAAMFYNDQQPDKIFYQGLAWLKLGDRNRALAIFNSLIEYGEKHLDDTLKIDYFAVSLPDLLIFEDDLNKRNKTHCHYISGLGYLGIDEFSKAEELFNKALLNDAMHFGVKTHLDLLKQVRKNNEPIKFSHTN